MRNDLHMPMQAEQALRAASARAQGGSVTPVNRPLQVVHLVSMFQQMTASQIEGVLYAACRSHTSVVRDLNKLLADRYLMRFPRVYHRVKRRGQGEWVYTLDRNGWKFIGYESPYSPLTAVLPHSIAIGDLYVDLVSLERLGMIEVLEYSTEPDTWVRIGHTELRPDFYTRIRSRRDNSVSRVWLEVDIGSEHVKQIKDKVRRYRRAYESADGTSDEWRVWPRVVFVVRDEVTGDDQRRANDIRKWIAQVDRNDGLFAVCTYPELASVLID